MDKTLLKKHWTNVVEPKDRKAPPKIKQESEGVCSCIGQCGCEASKRKASVTCPECKQPVWDVATVDQALNKCWNCGAKWMNDPDEQYQEIAVGRFDDEMKAEQFMMQHYLESGSYRKEGNEWVVYSQEPIYAEATRRIAGPVSYFIAEVKKRFGVTLTQEQAVELYKQERAFNKKLQAQGLSMTPENWQKFLADFVASQGLTPTAAQRKAAQGTCKRCHKEGIINTSGAASGLCDACEDDLLRQTYGEREASDSSLDEQIEKTRRDLKELYDKGEGQTDVYERLTKTLKRLRDEQQASERQAAQFGSVEWQSEMEKRVMEKKKKGLPLDDAEEAFVETQAEHNKRMVDEQARTSRKEVDPNKVHKQEMKALEKETCTMCRSDVRKPGSEWCAHCLNEMKSEFGKPKADRKTAGQFTKKATGEPDQDYDHELYDGIATALAAEGYEASHKEFDKYQGVYLKVRGHGVYETFWTEDVFFSGEREGDPAATTFTYKPGTEQAHYIFYPESQPDVKIQYDAGGDVSDFVSFMESKQGQKKGATMTKVALKLWTSPSDYMGEEYPDYYVGLSQTRDSDALERSNFKSALAMLGGEKDGVIVARFNHWAVGWVETILVHKDSKDKVAILQDIENKMAGYPVLDDDDFYQAESEQRHDDYTLWAKSDAIDILAGEIESKITTEQGAKTVEMFGGSDISDIIERAVDADGELDKALWMVVEEDLEYGDGTALHPAHLIECAGEQGLMKDLWDIVEGKAPTADNPAQQELPLEGLSSLKEEWHVEYFPHDSDKRVVKKGFTSKAEAEAWAKAENLKETATDLEVVKASWTKTAKNEKVFTCPETDDLSGICHLCHKDISGHDSEYRCQDNPDYGKEIREAAKDWETCTNCGGDGYVEGKECPACEGTGRLPLSMEASMEKKAEEKRHPYITWDTGQIAEDEAKYFLDEPESNDHWMKGDVEETWEEAGKDGAKFKELLKAKGLEGTAEQQARDDAYEDSGLVSLEWDSMVSDLSTFLAEKNPSGRWLVSVEGFGWRKLNGQKIVNTNDGQTFLREVLPDTDVTFYIYDDGGAKFSINNFHHDSPTGEWYYAEPAPSEEVIDAESSQKSWTKAAAISKQQRDAVEQSLTNDEASSDEELVEHFINELKMSAEDAAEWVAKRDTYLNIQLCQKCHKPGEPQHDRYGIYEGIYCEKCYQQAFNPNWKFDPADAGESLEEDASLNARAGMVKRLVTAMEEMGIDDDADAPVVGEPEWTDKVLQESQDYFAKAHMVPDEDDLISYIRDIADNEAGIDITMEMAEEYFQEWSQWRDTKRASKNDVPDERGAKNWKVRYYDAKDKLISEHVIENRDQHQAEHEATGDMPANAEDWSMTPVQKKKADFADEHGIADEPAAEDLLNDETPMEPAEGDVIIQDEGALGAATVAYADGKQIAKLHDDWDKFYGDIYAWMKKENYYPNVWQMSDHGNVSEDTGFGEYVGKHQETKTAGSHGAPSFQYHDMLMKMLIDSNLSEMQKVQLEDFFNSDEAEGLSIEELKAMIPGRRTAGRDEEIVKRDIELEQAAIDEYRGQKEDASPDLKKVLDHAIEQEREHRREFETKQVESAITPEERVKYTWMAKNLKSVLRPIIGFPISVRTSGSVRPNPYIEVSSVNWETNKIPNDFRAKVIAALGVDQTHINMENIHYGNVTDNRIALPSSEWEKVLSSLGISIPEQSAAELPNEKTAADESYQGLGKFVGAYLEAALWSSTDNADESGGEPLDANYDFADIAPESLEKAKADCAAFIDKAGDLLSGIDDEQAGHDFWLTRNGHGAGFWDRGLGDVGQQLTDIAHSFGETNLVVGDDSKLYLEGSMNKTAADGIRLYGPGKFGTIVDQVAWELTMAGADEEVSNENSGEWYGLLKSVTVDEAEKAAVEVGVAPLNEAEKAWFQDNPFIIIGSDSQGLVGVNGFSDEAAATKLWNEIVMDMTPDEELGAEGSVDDTTTCKSCGKKFESTGFVYCPECADVIKKQERSYTERVRDPQFEVEARYTGDFEKDLKAIAPYVLADGVSGNDTATSDWLVERAKAIYKANPTWGKKISKDDEGARDMLTAFMAHWLEGRKKNPDMEPKIAADAAPAVGATREQKIQQAIDMLSKDADIIAIVKEIEAKPATTKGHYGNYMRVLDDYKKNRTMLHIVAEALINAGANAEGVQAALGIMSGSTFGSQVEPGQCIRCGTGTGGTEMCETCKKQLKETQTEWDKLPPLNTEAGLSDQVKSLRRKLKELDVEKADPSEIASTVDALEKLEKRLKDQQETRQQKKDEKAKAAEEAQTVQAGLSDQVKTLRKKLKELDVDKADPSEIASTVDALEKLEKRLKEQQETRKTNKEEKAKAAEEAAKTEVTAADKADYPVDPKWGADHEVSPWQCSCGETITTKNQGLAHFRAHHNKRTAAEFGSHGLGHGLDDLYVLPSSPEEADKIIAFLKEKGRHYAWSNANVKGHAWYGKRFLDIAFGQDLQPEIEKMLSGGQITSSLNVAAATNEQVVQMFASDSFPKDKMPTWGTQHLKINKEPNGWALINYNTPIAYRSNDGKAFINTQKYSVTTSRIQSVLKSAMGAAAEVDEAGMKAAMQEVGAVEGIDEADKGLHEESSLNKTATEVVFVEPEGNNGLDKLTQYLNGEFKKMDPKSRIDQMEQRMGILCMDWAEENGYYMDETQPDKFRFIKKELGRDVKVDMEPTASAKIASLIKQADHLYGLQSVRAEEMENGDLIISVDEKDQKEIAEFIERTDDTSENAFFDATERLLGNGYSWVAPETIGALTSAPIISDTFLGDEDPDFAEDRANAKVWWFPEYETTSPLAVLADRGRVVFTLAPADKEVESSQKRYAKYFEQFKSSDLAGSAWELDKESRKLKRKKMNLKIQSTADFFKSAGYKFKEGDHVWLVSGDKAQVLKRHAAAIHEDKEYDAVALDGYGNQIGSAFKVSEKDMEPA